MMLGIQKMTNFWTFPIYTVIISVTLMVNCFVKYSINTKSVLNTLGYIAEILIIQAIVTFPFTNDLYLSATTVLFTHKTSALYKLIVLWGIPFACTLFIVIDVLYKYIKNRENIKFMEYIKRLEKADIYVIILAICGIGLIILPEIIYLKDIYGEEYKRFNTVFKLTYEAFILLQISSSYIIVKNIYEAGSKIKYFIISILLVLQCLTLGYGIEAIMYTTKNKPISNMADSEMYIKRNNPGDYEAINWIKNNIDKNDVILETCGESYNIAGRVSVFTGNPTVLGWHTHEWLWRAEKDYSVPEEENNRWMNIQYLYTKASVDVIKNYVEEYKINYIYIGYEEIKRYGDKLNINNIVNAGEVVYEKNYVYIVKMQ